MNSILSQEIWDCKGQNILGGVPNPFGANAELMDEVADRLRLIRAMLGHQTQQAMATFLSVEFNRYNNIERGSALSHEIAVKICQKVPGMTLDWLYFGKTGGLTLDLAKRLEEASMASALPSKTVRRARPA